jgi:hypothetical protein
MNEFIAVVRNRPNGDELARAALWITLEEIVEASCARKIH